MLRDSKYRPRQSANVAFFTTAHLKGICSRSDVSEIRESILQRCKI